MSTDLTCPMCGHRFEPEAEQSPCSRCPLHRSGCAALACCPVCGYTVVDVRRGWLSARVARWLSVSFQSSNPEPAVTVMGQEEAQ